MSYREIPINVGHAVVEGTADVLGLQTKVEVSDHSIDVEYTTADQDNRAWDPNLYRNGNLFVAGYANPIKPQVHDHPQLEDPNVVDVVEGEPEGEGEEGETDTDDDDGPHVAIISSSRYRDYMRQDLVSQLLTPQEQWKLIAYGVLGLGILQFIAIIITMYATGSF